MIEEVGNNIYPLMKNIAELIKWHSDLSVGHDELDLHHKRLIGLINDLYAALIQRASFAEMNDILTHLDEYAQAHFRYEEKAMEEAGYPGLDAQRKAHDAYRARTEEAIKEFRSSADAVSHELLDFLKDWWKNHILKLDKQYTPYLQHLPKTALREQPKRASMSGKPGGPFRGKR